MSFFSTRLDPGTLATIHYFRIGKHKGKTLAEAFAQEPRYFRWLLHDAELGPTDTFVVITFLHNELSVRGWRVPPAEDFFDKSAFDILWPRWSGSRSYTGAGAGSAGTGSTSPLGAIPEELRGVALEVIGAGRRALALVHHPDRGGDTERMVQANRAADLLEQSVRGTLGWGGAK